MEGIKRHPSNDFDLAVESNSDTNQSKSSKSKQKKTSERENLSNNDSPVSKNKKLDKSSHVADCTCSKLLQQAKDNLVGEMNRMRITKTAALTMHDIAEWCLVGRKESNYVNPATFDEASNHQDEDERQE